MNMKVFIGIGILLMIVVGVQVFGKKEVTQQVNQQVTEQTALSSQTNSEGSVTVEVTPQITSDSFRFDVTMDTHSGDLADDLTTAARLTDDGGYEYSPTGWEGDPPGGHHRKGTLEFGVAGFSISGFELTIMDVGGVEERRFKW